MHQQIDELITTYVSHLREKASKCELEKYKLEERLNNNGNKTRSARNYSNIGPVKY